MRSIPSTNTSRGRIASAATRERPQGGAPDIVAVDAGPRAEGDAHPAVAKMRS
jgi:hypothetical protein